MAYTQLESNNVLVSFYSYPLGDTTKFVKNYSNSFKEQRLKYLNSCKIISGKDGATENETYYKQTIPYHIFGKSDVLFLNLLDNYRYNNNYINSVKDHVRSNTFLGVPFKKNKDSLAIFKGFNESKNQNFDFVSVSKLKINNYLLIGNGYDVIDFVVKQISAKLKDEKFLLLFTHGSFELLLIIFSHSHKTLKNKIFEIRNLQIKDCDNYENIKSIEENSLYNDNEQFRNAHLLFNSQTNLGVKLIGINKKFDWAVKESDEFYSQIEFEIKPGHECEVEKIFKGNTVLDNFLKFSYTGKRDFYYKFELDNLKTNYNIFQLAGKKEFEDHINRIVTRIYFKEDENNEPINNNGNINHPCEKLIFHDEKIKKINKNLKTLKISRELRYRIKRIFKNYNIVIKNKFVYAHFIDLYHYLKKFKKYIKDESEKITKYYQEGQIIGDFLSVDDIENSLKEMIDIYVESFNVRYVNNYMIDDVNDFFIEYSTPIQNIISSLDNYFKIIINHFNSTNINYNYIITRVNQLRTESNGYSINFNLYNLYEPSILFYASTKEVVNIINKNKPIDEKPFSDYWNKYYIENPYDHSFKLKNIILNLGLTYIYYDNERFKKFFTVYENGLDNFKFFLYFHFSTMAQYSTLYDTTGNFNKEYFVTELIRLIFLSSILDKENNCEEYTTFLKDNCPFKTMGYFWIKTFNESINAIRKYILEKFEFNNGINISLSDIESFDTLNENPNIINSLTFENIDASILQNNNLNLFCLNLSTSFMKKIYEEHCKDGKFNIPLLKRNWESNKIMKSDINENGSYFFINDPSGGAFFHDISKLENYSLWRNNLFVLLAHLGYVYKKQIIQSVINIQKVENNP